MHRLVTLSCCALFAFAFAAASGDARAEPPPEDNQLLLQQMFDQGGVDASWIAPAARAQLTPELIRDAVGAVTTAAGALQSIAPSGDNWQLKFERGTTTVVLVRNENGLIQGLWFQEVMPAGMTLDHVAAALATLPGEKALIVVRGDEVLAEHAPDAELLVASAFKLAVLGAVRDAIQAGTLAWDQVVRYDAADASLPSGMLQGYPDGHPITVATLAAMMIALSDNTATDVLIELVGRDRVEAVAGIAPILKTAEFFKLKTDQALFQRYVDGSLDERRAVLETLASMPLPSMQAASNGRSAHGWRLSVRTLCTLMAGVADLELMGINTGGMADADWEHIAFKGGNDIGVTNLTYMVTPPDGVPTCVSLTWNHADHFDDVRFSSIANRFLHVLRTGG